MKLEDNPAYKKYDGKTIKINGHVYKIRIFEYGQVIVELHSKYSGSYCDPRSDTEYDDNSDHEYQIAVTKAKMIAAELEEAEQTDFEVGVSFDSDKDKEVIEQ